MNVENKFQNNLRKKLSKDLFNRLKKRAQIVYGWVIILGIAFLGLQILLSL